jgi:hypothetical protein
MFTETLLKITFSVIGRCFLVPTSHWLQGKCSRMTFSVVVAAALGSLKPITGTERVFKGASYSIFS